MGVAQIGNAAPEFSLTCVKAGDESPRPVRLSDYCGRWLMLIFYPRVYVRMPHETHRIQCPFA